MFKKVQIKFFAIITSILLAIFIAVLASINLIMEAVMQRQSQVVLKQIAASIEYDETTSTFKYFQEPNDKNEPHYNKNNDSSSPSQSGTSGTSSTESTTSQTDEPTSEAITNDENQDESSEDSKTPSANSESSVSDDYTSENSSNSDTSVQTPSQTKAVTTAVNQHSQTITQTVKPTQQNTQAQTTQATQTQTQPQQTTQANVNPPDHGDEQRPPDGPYPPWHWEDGSPEWQCPTDENCYDYNDYYDYPRPEERDDFFWEYNKNAYEDTTLYIESDEEVPVVEEESFIVQSSPDTCSLLQINNKNQKILSDYTVINNYNKILLSDTATVMKNEAPVPKSLGSIDFFALMADSDGNYLASLNYDDLEQSVAQKYISAIIKDGAASGMLNNFQFFKLAKDNGTIMVFTDKSAEIDMLDQLTHTTILIGIATFILLSILSFYLSKKSIEPIKVAFEKQKQFVSDASHELKTPLTIISANADVLADEIGENKWLNYIKSQTKRMNVLVNDLLNLTRLENNTSDFVRTEFNLSQALTNTALPFECQAFESNKIFDVDIDEGIMLNGSEKHIKQLAAIFIDNAFKYSNDGGTISISLKKQGDKKIFSVFNTGAGVKDSEKNKIFERFYRSDDSRARTTGGYGLGLAIAKSIIDKHKFKVAVNNVEGESICFIVTMQ